MGPYSSHFHRKDLKVSGKSNCDGQNPRCSGRSSYRVRGGFPVSPHTRDVSEAAVAPHTGTNLRLPGGNCPLLYPPHAALQRQSKASTQRARPFHYLASQLLTTVLFLPGGHDSHAGTTEKFHEDAAKATAERAGEALGPQHSIPHPTATASPGSILHPLNLNLSPAGVTPEPLLRGSWEAPLDNSYLNPIENRSNPTNQLDLIFLKNCVLLSEQKRKRVVR